MIRKEQARDRYVKWLKRKQRCTNWYNKELPHHELQSEKNAMETRRNSIGCGTRMGKLAEPHDDFVLVTTKSCLGCEKEWEYGMAT